MCFSTAQSAMPLLAIAESLMNRRSSAVCALSGPMSCGLILQPRYASSMTFRVRKIVVETVLEAFHPLHAALGSCDRTAHRLVGLAAFLEAGTQRSAPTGLFIHVVAGI